MTDLTRNPSSSLLGCTRDLATVSEDELKRLAAEAARDVTVTPKLYGR